MENKVSTLQVEGQGTVEIIGGMRKYTYNNAKDKTFCYIEPGVYTLTGQMIDMMLGTIEYYMTEIELVSDNLIDLPSTEYQFVKNQVSEFVKPETQAKYKDLGFVYKRSILLYGAPGTGKTCLINRISQDIVAAGGIVLFAKDPEYLKILDDMFCFKNKTTLVAVILEEFDSHIRYGDSRLLTLLDGQIQRDNTMYLCTTNYIEKIPARILRPGRINLKVEVKFPSLEARRTYLLSKVKDVAIVESIAQGTEGLSIDELKEVVQSVLILNENLEATVTTIRELNVKIAEDEKNRKTDSGGLFRSFILGT